MEPDEIWYVFLCSTLVNDSAVRYVERENLVLNSET